MSFPRGTTPTFELVLPAEIDLSLADEVCVSFMNGRKQKLDKSTEDDAIIVNGNIVEVYLTQEESLKITEAEKNLEIQVNWKYPDGKRAATEVVSIFVDRQLLNEVM